MFINNEIADFNKIKLRNKKNAAKEDYEKIYQIKQIFFDKYMEYCKKCDFAFKEYMDAFDDEINYMKDLVNSGEKNVTDK